MTKEKNLQSRRQQIILEAAKLFHLNGFVGTSLQQIGHSVGMEGPSLYNHISSKHEILAVLLLDNARLFDTRMKEIASSTLSELEKIDKIISLHVELTLEDPDAMALMLSEWVHLKKADKREYLALKDEYEMNFRSILQRSIDNGDMIAIDVQFMLFMMLSTLRSLYAWCAKHKNYSRIDLERYLRAGIVDGLLNKKPR